MISEAIGIVVVVVRVAVVSEVNIVVVLDSFHLDIAYVMAVVPAAAVVLRDSNNDDEVPMIAVVCN